MEDEEKKAKARRLYNKMSIIGTKLNDLDNSIEQLESSLQDNFTIDKKNILKTEIDDSKKNTQNIKTSVKHIKSHLRSIM